jgi:hypothetical protein
MRIDPFGVLHHKAYSGDQGWEKDPTQPGEGKWKWSAKWGQQYSVEGFRMNKDFVSGTAVQRTHTISIRACRVITTAILHRSLCCVTNREAYNIADHTFSRCGAVPGILDALLVCSGNHYETTMEVREDRDASWRDVRREVVLAYESNIASERGAAAQCCNLNLFAGNPPSGQQNWTLYELGIRDAFSGSRKVLMIRYVRAGDGERGNHHIDVDPSGNLLGNIAVPMDMPFGGPQDRLGMHGMAITKEEFVACILASPILSETLRFPATSDNTIKHVPVAKPIKLDVLIADPNEKEQDEEFLDSMNARQSILLEIWDFDRAKADDFLGECWLPSLGTLTQGKKLVLPIHNSGRSDNGTRKVEGKKLAPNVECTGNLHVEAHWHFPIGARNDSTSLEDRVKEEELLHTGKLDLKIIKADGLRYSDIRRSKGSDPYVKAYIRNDAFGDPDKGWRKSKVTGVDETIMKTEWKARTVNPEFNHDEKGIVILTGSFEKKTKEKGLNLALTGRQSQRMRDTHAIKVIGETEELRLHFGDEEKEKKPYDERPEGARHMVKVFLGDSIHQFKVKLAEASMKEARESLKRAQQAKSLKKIDDELRHDDVRLQYQSVADGMSFKYAVMVFVPSTRLRELAQQNRTTSHEYKRLYRVEEQDPSSWQPLEPFRTFNHYVGIYGFGMHAQQRLRISEGTDNYKIKNTRYRNFERDLKQWGLTVRNVDTEHECFGYARYTHQMDGGSSEWRPAIIERKEDSGQGASAGDRFKADFCYAVPQRVALEDQGAMASDAAKIEIKSDETLLAQSVPKILGSTNLQHQEFLAYVQGLHTKGLNAQEICQKLNRQLEERVKEMKATGAKDQATPPPPITILEIQHHLRLLEASGLLVVDETAPTPAASGSSLGGAKPPSRPYGGASADSPTPYTQPEIIAGPSDYQDPGVPAAAAPKRAGPKMVGRPQGPRTGGPGGPGGDGPSMGMAGR